MNFDIANLAISIGQNTSNFDWVALCQLVFGIISLGVAIIAIFYTKQSIKDQNDNFRTQLNIQEQQWLNNTFINQRNIELIELEKKFTNYLSSCCEFNNMLFGIPTYSFFIDGDKSVKIYYKDIIGEPRKYLGKFVEKSVKFKEYLDNMDFILPVNGEFSKKIIALNNLYFSFIQKISSNKDLPIFDNSFKLIEQNYSFNDGKYKINNNFDLRILFIQTFTQWLPLFIKTNNGKRGISILEKYNFVGDRTCTDANFNNIAKNDNLFVDYLRCFGAYMTDCQKDIKTEIYKYMDKETLNKFFNKEGENDL